MNKGIDDPRRRNSLFFWGLAVSVVYLAGLGTYVSYSTQAFFALAPNDVGDFLAGAFSPLAFMWLVLGFIQQGRELTNSSRALRLQGEELRHSVEQQRQLVKAAREQLMHDKETTFQEWERTRLAAQPVLRMRNEARTRAGSRLAFSYRLINSGADITDVKIGFDKYYFAQSGLIWLPTLKRGESHDIKIVFEKVDFSQADVTVSYTDQLGDRHRVVFVLAASGPPSDIELRTASQPVEKA